MYKSKSDSVFRENETNELVSGSMGDEIKAVSMFDSRVVSIHLGLWDTKKQI